MDTRYEPLTVNPDPVPDAAHETGMDAEPVMIMNVVKTGLILLTAFGVGITDVQQDSVIKFAGALLAVLVIMGAGDFVARMNVFPARSVNKATAKAFEAGQKSGPARL